MEASICEFAGPSKIIDEEVYSKVAQEHFDGNVGQLIYIWMANIYYLQKRDFLVNDEKNGFVVCSGGNSIKYKSFKEYCAVCQKETKTRCSMCKDIYYCCTEHQKANWKSIRRNVFLFK